MKDRKVHLIGINHTKGDYSDLQKKLSTKASNREVVFGIEGTVRNKDKEERYIKELYGLERGFFRGLEDELPMTLCQLIGAHYISGLEIKDNFQAKREMLPKGQIVMELMDSPKMREMWERLKRGILDIGTIKTIEGLESFLELAARERVPYKVAMEGFKEYLKINPTLNESGNWIGLYRKLALETMSELKEFPQDQHPDFKVLEDYFNRQPVEEDDEKIILPINNLWRDQFLYKNSREVIKVGDKEDCYLLVGAYHVLGIKERLGKDRLPIDLVVASSETGIPENINI